MSLARRTFGLMVFVLGLTTLNTRACARVVAIEAPVTGPWHGQIAVAGMALEIVVVFTDAGGSDINGTNDIPQQGARGLALRNVTRTGDRVAK